jgi:hypothetical protein
MQASRRTVLKNVSQILFEKRSRMSDTQHWEKPARAKLWQEMNVDEKAEWVKAELQRMRSLYAMLSSQVREIGRRVKAIRNDLQENE